MLGNILNDVFFAGETRKIVSYQIQSNGQALNLTGYTADLYVKQQAKEWEDSVIHLTSLPVSGITLTAATGKVETSIDAADTASLSGIYDYKLELTSPGGILTRALSGTITILE